MSIFFYFFAFWLQQNLAKLSKLCQIPPQTFWTESVLVVCCPISSPHILPLIIYLVAVLLSVPFFFSISEYSGKKYIHCWSPPCQFLVMNLNLAAKDFTATVWLVGSGEPCFQGRPILYFMNQYAFTLPLQGYVPRPFISIGIWSRSSQQSVFGSANATDWAIGEGHSNSI